MKLKPLEIRSYPQSLERRNECIETMENLIKQAKTEKRSLSSAENTQYEKLKAEVESIDKASKEDKIEMRSVKKPGNPSNALEVRGYTKEERIGSNALDVTVGDLIYSHITGKFRNSEVRQSLSTTSGGLAIPVEVYKDFIDLLRNQSFLGETTIYPMQTKSLLIPKVTGDLAPYFKLENDPVIESNPIFDSISLVAKPLYCMTSVSLELIEASNLDVGQVITTIMANAMRATMQNALIFGATNGYSGLTANVDIPKVYSGTPDLTYSAIGEGIKSIKRANGEAKHLVAHGDPLVDLELTTDTTGQFITPPPFFQNLNVFSVNDDMGTGEMFIGDLNNSIAWGILSDGGLQIEIDRYGTAFSNGQIKIRARINSDFAVTNPNLLARILTGTAV